MLLDVFGEFMKYQILIIILSINFTFYAQEFQTTGTNKVEENMNEAKIEIVKKFIDAYNSMDVDKMLTYLHPEIEFKNISNGEVNAHTFGIKEFKEIANTSIGMFKQREQKIISYEEEDDKINVTISYHAILAIDLPNGLQAGESLDLEGKSEYIFKDNLIISIVDES